MRVTADRQKEMRCCVDGCAVSILHFKGGVHFRRHLKKIEVAKVYERNIFFVPDNGLQHRIIWNNLSQN